MKHKIILCIVFFLLIGGYAYPKEEDKQNGLTGGHEAKSKDTIDIIIKFKDVAEDKEFGKGSAISIHAKKAKIARQQDYFISAMESGKKNFRLNQKYSLVNGMSATIAEDELDGLLDNPAIDRIYLDLPMHIMLNDSVMLINATAFWGINLSGYKINGSTETVCILDTGIDYRHPALGGCNILNHTKVGNNATYILESAHPYSNDAAVAFKINQTGFGKISLHFANISLEEEYDYIKILDPNSNNNTIAVYTGNHTDIWTPSVNGDTIYVLLESDESIDGWGFKVDKILNGTMNTTLNWSLCNKVIGGWDFTGTDSQLDEDPMDDHDHGTHVAGIIASENSTYRGVAPGARIVAVKVMDSSGSGTDGDIMAGIEFCIENKDRLNISVISMSLGSSELWYDTFCDSDFPLMSELVDEATRQNISIIAASGNEANSSGISYPSCLQNITSVGATTKSDSIDISYSNSAHALDLLAPGTSIMSVNLGGGFASQSGTSMATPHAAGAFLLLRSFKRLENGTVLTPYQLVQAFKSTGKNITDSRNSQNYARINLSSALAYIDDNPRITFIQIPVNTSNTSANFTFINITTTEELSNATIEINAANHSMSGTSRNFYYNMTGMISARHNFTVFVKDKTHNTFVTSGSYFVTVDTVKPDISSVANISVSVNSTVQSISFQTLEATNSTIFYGTLQGNYAQNISNSTFAAYHNFTLTDLSPSTTYYYYLQIIDKVGNLNTTGELSFLTAADPNPPALLIGRPQNSSSYATSSLAANLTASEPSACTFNFTSGTVVSLPSNLTHLFSTSLSDGTYNLSANCTDSDGNSARAYAQDFTIDTTSPTINLTAPQNNTVLNGSYGNLIIFSTSEIATCTYAVNNNSVAAASSTDARYFTATFSVYTGVVPLHNLTINCTDALNNSRAIRSRFQINDTAGPLITIDSESATDSSIEIDFSTDEPSNWTVSIEGEADETSSSFSVSHTTEFTGLESDTEYEYNVTACDTLGNCAVVSDSKSTRSENSGGGGGGGGGGGSSSSVSAIPNTQKANQLWSNIAEGKYTMTILPGNISVREVTFILDKNLSGSLVIAVEKIDSLPVFIPDLPGVNYQFMKIEKSGAKDTNLSSVTLRFRVESKWLETNDIEPSEIILFRFDEIWQNLSTAFTRSDSSFHYFESETPGFSYFIVHFDETKKDQVRVNESEILNVSQPVEDLPPLEKTNETAPALPDGPEKRRNHFAILAVLVLAILGGITAYMLNRKKI